MDDCGFTLVEELACMHQAEFIMPYFTKGKEQLSVNEVELTRTRKSANVCIHFEEVIGHMK